MAYNSNQHNNFVNRTTNWMRGLWQLDVERQKLFAIYWNEAVGDPAFADTAQATTGEIISAMNVMEDVERLIHGTSGIIQQSRVANFAPFLAGE